MKKHASISETGGVEYREIADIMTSIGFQMNHSSARNYVLRVMKKFATEIADSWSLDLSEDEIVRIAKSPQFQQGICDVLYSVEAEKSPKKGKF